MAGGAHRGGVRSGGEHPGQDGAVHVPESEQGDLHGRGDLSTVS
ncbi:hypothetical protein ACFFX0_12185 [Citricoccus parietis]|uniref:Uncharacterized protein n=1 Tax=Citricoccus parietis TaxID=592307 RepID=A0ABV5FZ32_9MICC